MRNSPKQYAAHLAEHGKRPLEYWPHTAPVDHVEAVQRLRDGFPASVAPRSAVKESMIKAQTVRPPAPEVTPQSLRDLAAEMRADASRWLTRANDLELAAKRLEGE